MGTTLSLVRLYGATAEVGHVGDSRIYHLRSDGLVDRTVDQTEVEELVQRGVLSRGRARRYPRRHVLLSVLSPSRKYDLQRQQFNIQNGDRLLLITDGVSPKMLRREIRDLSLKKQNPQLFCDALADEIEKRGPQDDYSAICVDIKEQ
jgi:PPM family protein phosphatase